MNYFSYQKQHKGFSLLELLLVLVVIIGLLLASYSRFRRYEQEKEIRVVQQNVAMLQQALDEFYGQLDSPEKNKDINIKDHEDKFNWPNLISSNLVVKGWSHDNCADGLCKNGYKVKIATGIPISDNEYAHNLIVQAQFTVPAGDIMGWYAKALNASSREGDVLTWQKMPSYFVPHIGSDLWPLTTQLKIFKKSQTYS